MFGIERPAFDGPLSETCLGDLNALHDRNDQLARELPT
jgi:hypothetical protein